MALRSKTGPGKLLPDATVCLYRKLSLWLFLLLLATYATVTRGHFFTIDEIAVFQQTRSLWEHGDLDVAPLPNTFQSHRGRYYAVYGPAQSVLALPFYATGKTVRLGLEYIGARTWSQTLIGPTIGEAPGRLFGGEVEIFFVNLFNAVSIALLAAVFFLFNLRLGAAPRWALTATLILGLATHIAGFSACFFQHGAESLFVLWSIYFLYCDSAAPRWQSRLAGGFAAGAMLLTRINTAVLLPTFTAYLAVHSWSRIPRDGRRQLASLLRECVPFCLPVFVSLLAVGAVNEWKFGMFSLRGAYAQVIPFSTPLLAGLYGNLFSVGQSIFLFSPILLLTPFYFRDFARRHPAETTMIFAASASSLLLYSKIYLWHGQWCFGPRYLVHLVPLLLLPLGCWLQQGRRSAWLAVAFLATAGFLVEILHVTVNVSYVYYHEGYSNMKGFAYLFIPEASQLAAHWRALCAWDSRVDMWLVNVVRQFGLSRLTPIAICLVWWLSWCIRQVIRYLREAETAWAAGLRSNSSSAARRFDTEIKHAHYGAR